MELGMNMPVEVISADINRLSEDLLEEHSVRLYSRGGHFTASQLLPVYFILVAGCSEPENYSNFIFSLRDDMKKSNRPFAFIDTPLGKPSDNWKSFFTNVDMSRNASVISGLCRMISLKNDPGRTYIAQKALGDILSGNAAKMFDTGLGLADKINTVGNAIGTGYSDKIPLIMYYGIPTPEDVLFLCYAQRCAMDVVCISPDKKAVEAFKACPFAEKLQIEELPQSRPVTPFPTKLVKAKIATTAYNAERELDTMIYGGDTIFRDRQFSKMDSAVLKTTFDEIFMLWEQDAKYRSGFEVRGDRVIVPTIFAKVNGVPGGKIKEYWKLVDDMLTPSTVFITKSPSYRRPTLNVTAAYAPYHDGKNLRIDRIKNSELNKYGFISEELQALIFEKLQAMIYDGLLEMDSETEMIDYIMYAGLNIDRRVLRLMMQHDYTKEVPKIVVADAIEEPFSKMECTQLLLFSYMGFDVVVFSPCGYRDVETYVSNAAFETHSAGEYLYNVSVPKLKVPDVPRAKKKKGGLFKNLFK